MEIYPYLLFRLLLASFLFGVLMGGLYDTIRIQRVLLGINRYTEAANAPVFCPKFCQKKRERRQSRITRAFQYVFLFLQDVLFCVTAGILLAILLFYQNHGELRGFVPLFAVLGFLVYYFTVGKLVIRLSEYLVMVVKTAVLYVVYYATRPLVIVGRFILTRGQILWTRWKQKRTEKAILHYHQKRSRAWSEAARNGFLDGDWLKP